MKQMIERQVNRVRRRLFLTALLERLAWSWAVALLLSAVWFLVGPYLIDGWRWPVLGALLTLATVVAVALTRRRARLEFGGLEQVKAECREKRGTLKSGKGGKGGTVKSRKQAIAIGLSEARKKGAKVPKKPKAA